jgi:hypothetical protein
MSMADIATINYLQKQLFTVAPLPLNEKQHYPYGIDVQFSSQHGKTNHLKISPAQMKQIEEILLGVAK